jgi:UDP-3-O-[3-hydroxymyristoyl] N-acetylglucosamine deacetylase
MDCFATLERAVSVEGIGLHTGARVLLRLLPSPQEGIELVRVDLPGSPTVRAAWDNVTSTTHATTLQQQDARVSTVEHLLAALWTQGITHCRIELDAPEVPILDGSAQGWVEAIHSAGLKPLPGTRPIWQLNHPVWWEGQGATVFGVPDTTFRLSVAVDYNHPHAGAQSFDGVVDAASFTREMASARTFTLEPWIEALQNAGLIRGGSEENAIVLRDSGPSSPLRFSNELARHKALDVVGDLALLFGSARFNGHIFALRAGHGPHRAWIEKGLHERALELITR